MNTTQETPMVDFWAIYNELVKTQSLERRTEQLARFGWGGSKFPLEEFGVIGIRIPRQCGKTTFVQQFMDRHPTALGVVTHSGFRNDLTARCETDTTDRIMTAREFKGGEFAEPLVERPIWDAKIAQFTHVIVDESLFVYKQVARKWLYTLFARNPNIIVVEIN